MKLSSSSPRCLGRPAAGTAAVPAHSGLPEGYTFHEARQKSQFPGSMQARAHRVSAPLSQERDVKILLLGVGSCPLRSGGLFFSFRVIFLNYRKSDQGPFLDRKETKFKRPFTASYLSRFILLNTTVRAAQTIANQERTITMSQKHLLFI